ncbi:MAG TPA: hypothetical protein VHS29_08405 [Candidatus Acidoferrales bacterium]|jgi:hypothetical protein|nr:hypothetical protein [Candidatus Acidoferrales bacterium]
MSSPLLKSLVIFALMGLGTGVSATVEEQIKRPISIIISPKAKSYTRDFPILVDVAITDNTTEAMWFFSCPPPYILQLTQVGNRTVELGRHDPNEVYECFKNILSKIKSGDTWKDEINISDLHRFEPGSYRLEILWSFPVNTTKTPSGVEISDSLSVRSNTIEFNVQQKQHGKMEE